MSKAVKAGGAKGLVPRLRFPEFRDTDAWSTKTVEQLCDSLDGDRKPVTKTDRQSGEYPYYGASGIVDYVDSYIFDEELVLIGEDGAKWGPYEPTAFVAKGKYWVNNHAHVLRPTGIVAGLLADYLSKIDLSPYVTGAAPPKLTGGKLSRIPIPVANRAEQQRIAGCLSSLDDLITAHTDRLAAMKQHKQGLLKQIFSYEGGAMPRARFPEFRNNSDWHTFPLGDVCEIETGRRDANEGAVDGAYPFFTCAAENLRINTYSFDEEAILIAGNANVGQTTYYSGKFDAYQRTYVLTRFRHVSVKYLYHFLDATLRTALSSQVQTGAMSYIRLPMLTAYPVMAPRRIEEQVRIAALLSNLDALLSAHADKLTALKQHKQGLLQQLFPTIDDTTQP